MYFLEMFNETLAVFLNEKKLIRVISHMKSSCVKYYGSFFMKFRRKNQIRKNRNFLNVSTSIRDKSRRTIFDIFHANMEKRKG